MSSPKTNYLERNSKNPDLPELREQLASMPMLEAVDTAFAEYAAQVCAQDNPQAALLAAAKIEGARRVLAVLLGITIPQTKTQRPDGGRLLQEGELVGKTNA